MEDYCGSPFWDWNVTWNTSSPDLTSCFQRTVLVWIPSIFLIISALTVLGKRSAVFWSGLNLQKAGLIGALIIIQLIDLVWRLAGSGTRQAAVNYFTPGIKAVTFILALALTILRKKNSSGILFNYWLLLLFCGIPGFRTAITNPKPLPSILEQISFPTIILIWVLNCWAEPSGKSPVEKKPCPYTSASYLSRLTFFWVESLARKGYRKALTFGDLWDLQPQNTSKGLNPKFSQYWEQRAEGASAQPQPAAVQASYAKSNGEVKFKPEDEQPAPQSSLGMFKILSKTFGPTFLFASFLKFIQDLLTFVSPLILKLILDQIHDQNSASVVADYQHWRSYFYVFLLLLSSTIGTLIGNQYFYQMYLMGLRVRTTVAGCLYRKCLKISPKAKEETTTGSIVNLMSVDVQKLMDICPYLTTLWSTPLIIGLSLYFLYGLLGASVFVGLGVMILLIPVNAVIGIRVRRFQTRQMGVKDKRIKIINEILAGIKVLKLYAWEPPYETIVTKLRESEIDVLRDSVNNTAGAMFLWTCAPVLVSIVTFTTYVLIDENNVLDAQKAFVSLSLFNIMRLPLNLLPMMLVSIIQAAISFKRIDNYMNSPEVDDSSLSRSPNESHPITVEDNATFSYSPDSPTACLKNLNLSIPAGSLVAVVGGVGSGKSTLLSALCGELHTLKGKVNVAGSVAFVSQEAWIQNRTLRGNILFEKEMDQARYDQVLDACALGQDLVTLPQGDETVIGEKGINLSGGQKQRISLARAVYSESQNYFLDDVLSAVDSHVGKHLFDHVIGPKGLLQHKTRLLVTHGLTYLPQMDTIIVLKDGEISEVGTYRELLERKGSFADFLIQHASTVTATNDEDQLILKDLELIIGEERILHVVQQHQQVLHAGAGDHSDQETTTLLAKEAITKPTSGQEPPASPPANLIEDEEMETGNIQLNVVLYYMRLIGWVGLGGLLFQLVYQVFAVGSNVWLSVWSSEVRSTSNTTLYEEGYSRDTYLTVYSLFGLGQGLAIFIATLIMARATLHASSLLHFRMLHRLLRAPLSFFDSTPSGRIVNRFSKDVDITDNSVPMSLSSWIKCVLNVLAAFGIIIYTTPGFVVVIIPTAILYFLAQRFYVCTSRQLRRLESVSRSPIFSHFSESLHGAPTIRAYGMESIFITQSEAIIDSNQKCYFASIVTTRYLAVFLESTGNFVVFFAFLFSVMYSGLTGGMVGLALSYALQITHGLNWLVDTTSNVENNLVAVERLKEYGDDIVQEADWETTGDSTWPTLGQITYEKYSTRYRPGLDLVLKDISFQVVPREKIGICGRTGAGKSSIALSLFRIIESAGGCIRIDGRDTSQMGLHDLRRRMAIIPQDPVIFSGTLRSNLDPFSEYEDKELWACLELAHLKGFVEGLEGGGLEYFLTEGGGNLSTGQKQLVCLARALLRKKNCRIIFFDEATSNVDLETDTLIQETIRTEFRESTVLTIAHRLRTILDYDRIIVMDQGRISEFDTANNLLNNSKGLFYSMAKDAGII